MDVYTHGFSSLKREADDNVVEFMMPTKALKAG
jgi:hypothetical protein